MRKTTIAAALAAAVAGVAVPAIASADTRCVNPQNNTTTGALVGAAGGAAAGSLLAGRHDRGKGAVLGALGGALLGGAVGHGQTRCPDGYYAYDEQTRQYYDNSGQVYAPQGAYGQAGYNQGAGPNYNQGPGYGPPPPQGAYDRGPPPAPGRYDRGPGPGPGPGYGGGDYYRGAPQSPRERLDWAQARIDRAIERGRLNPREAENARSDLADIRRQYYRLSRRDGGSLNGADRQYINDRLATLARNVRWDSADRY